MTDSANRQANEAALKQHRPQLLEWLHQPASGFPSVRLLPSDTRFPDMGLQVPGQQEVRVYDGADPIARVEQQLNSIDRSSPYTPILFGVGAGYALRILYDRFASEFFDCIVVEDNPAVMRLAFDLLDFTDVIADPRCFFFAGNDLAQWQGFVRDRLPGLMSGPAAPLPVSPQILNSSPFFTRTLQNLQQRIRVAEAEFDLMIRHGEVIQKNYWFNLPAICNSAPVQALKEKASRHPAIVVAAGPSLDRNVEMLRQAPPGAVIIAVDTALRTLIEHQVTPHLVISTDSTPLNHRHFQDVELPPASALVYDPELYWEIPQHWPGLRIYAGLEKSMAGRWLESVLGPFGSFPKGLSIGNSAFQLAEWLGCTPIVLVGYDLAFDPAGGRTHSAGSALYREVNTIPEGSTETRLGKRRDGQSEIQESLVWVPGVNHQVVPTSRVMHMYLNQLQEDIMRCGKPVMDATEGGACIEGTRPVSLAEAIGNLPADTDDALSLMASLKALQPDATRLLDDIRRIREDIVNVQSIAQHGLQLVEALRQSEAPAETLRQTDAWKQMEDHFNQIHRSQAIKIAMEQLMFSAIYQFVRKEWPHELPLRLQKYQRYFQCVLDHQPTVLQWIDEVLKQLQPDTRPDRLPD